MSTGSNIRSFAPELSAAPPLPARAEYLERQDRARAALAEAELDGLLAFGSRNWAWAVRWLADHQSGFQQQGADQRNLKVTVIARGFGMHRGVTQCQIA